MDVERAADLYAQGWTLRQIGAELGVFRTTVSVGKRSGTFASVHRNTDLAVTRGNAQRRISADGLPMTVGSPVGSAVLAVALRLRPEGPQRPGGSGARPAPGRADGPQRWIQAVDLRPASGSRP